jgi:hypothetical protein
MEREKEREEGEREKKREREEEGDFCIISLLLGFVHAITN